MWKLYVLSIVVIILMVRFIGSVDFQAQTKHVSEMEARCLKTRAPILMVLIGTSEDLAHGLFEVLQKAECPRRLRVHCIEFTGHQKSSQERAAVLYERAVRLRGLFDCLFDEQITWTVLDGPKRPLEDLAMILDSAPRVPFCGLFVPSKKYQLQSFWESQLETSCKTLTDDSHVLTGIPNFWPRSHPDGPPRLVWTPLHMASGLVPIVFPGPLWFGVHHQIRNMVHSFLLQDSEMHVSLWPFHASYLSFSYFGLSVFEPMPGNFETLDAPKVSSSVAKEYIQKHQPVLWPKHCLGLDPEHVTPVEAVTKYGSLGAYKRAIQMLNGARVSTNKSFES